MAELKKIIVMLIILFFLFPALDLAYGEPTQHSNRYNHVSNDHLSSDTTQTISTADKDTTPAKNNVVHSTPAEKKTPQITWSNPADITYGTALSSTQLNAVATDPVTNAPVAGTFTYTPVDGTVLNTGTQTLQVVFTPADAANYNTATQTAQINVVQSTPEQNNIVPSTPAQNNVVQSTPEQNNVVESTPAQINVVQSTPEQNNVVQSTPEQNNIVPSTPAQKITPTITWSNPADITYGTELSNTQLNAVATDPVTNVQVAGTFTCSPRAGTKLSVGTHTLHVDFTPEDTTTYNTASADVKIK